MTMSDLSMRQIVTVSGCVLSVSSTFLPTRRLSNLSHSSWHRESVRGTVGHIRSSSTVASTPALHSREHGSYMYGRRLYNPPLPFWKELLIERTVVAVQRLLTFITGIVYLSLCPGTHIFIYSFNSVYKGLYFKDWWCHHEKTEKILPSVSLHCSWGDRQCTNKQVVDVLRKKREQEGR